MLPRFFASTELLRSVSTLAALVALFSAVGCSKSADSQSRGGPAASVRSATVPSVLGCLPSGARVVAYAPSLASVVDDWTKRVLDGSQSPDVTSQVTRLLKNTPFAQGLAAARGEMVVGLYGIDDENPTFVGFVAGDTAPQLDALLRASLDSSTGNAVTVAGQTLSANSWAGQPVVHGVVPGGWVAGSDTAAVEYLLNNRSTPVGNELVDAWQAVATSPPRLFASITIGDVFKTAQDKEQAKMLGVDGVDRVSLALFESSSRQQDSLFIHTKAPHRGAFAAFTGKPLDRSLASKLPASLTGYTAISLDLLGAWNGFRTGLPDQFKSQLDMAEQGLKLDVGKDLLAHIGSPLSFAQFTAASGQDPVVLASIGLASRAGFKATLDKVKSMAPVPLDFSPGAGGVEFLNVPGNATAAPGVALTDDALLFCDSRAALDGLLSGTIKTGASSEVAGLFERFGGRAVAVSWVSRESLASTKNYKEVLATALSQGPKSAVSEAWGAFTWMAIVPALGDLGVAVVPEDKGLRVVLETDCGLTPVLALFSASSIEREQDQMARQSIDGLATHIRAAQERYHEQFGRFATSLWELERVKLVGADMASGIDGRLLYRVVANDTAWHLEVRHEAAALRYSVRSDGFVQAIQ